MPPLLGGRNHDGRRPRFISQSGTPVSRNRIRFVVTRNYYRENSPRVYLDEHSGIGPLSFTNKNPQGLLRDLKSSRELHSSHHTTLGRASTSPKTGGNLLLFQLLEKETRARFIRNGGSRN